MKSDDWLEQRAKEDRMTRFLFRVIEWVCALIIIAVLCLAVAFSH